MLDRVRQLAKAVNKFRSKRIDACALLKRGKSPIKAQAQLQVRDVALRDQHRGAERDLRAPLLLPLTNVAALERRHRLLQHRLVEFKANLLNVARLLLAKEIASTADVHVVAREREAGAQRVE